MRTMTGTVECIPSALFDNLLWVYSQCGGCGTLMRVTRYDEHCHPGCQAKTRRIEALAAQWRDAVLAGADTTQLEAAINEIEAAPPQLSEAAITYASWGWPVFPLAANSKKPAIGKSQGGRGCLDATNDVRRIKRWWAAHPHHNIGIATGHACDVLDVDTPAATNTFLELLSDEELPPCHGLCSTARAGLHLYYPPEASRNAARLERLPGLDWRGEGGYVVAPPSRLGARWRAYSWLAVPSPRIRRPRRKR